MKRPRVLCRQRNCVIDVLKKSPEAGYGADGAFVDECGELIAVGRDQRAHLRDVIVANEMRSELVHDVERRGDLVIRARVPDVHER